jgi:uncharacterized protein (DUF2235 family)
MNLALFFDGTWNEPNDRTNAYLLYQITPEKGDQETYYVPGVGTRGQGVFGLAERFLGGAFGDGLSDNIKSGYKWLCERYVPGAKIYIFGFSRGAYSARSLAGLVRKCGIVRVVSDEFVQQAYSVYRDTSSSTDQQTADYRKAHSVETDIEFVGVWDTVGELGIPVAGVPIPGFSDFYKFHDTTLANTTKAAYHALAANEFRSLYAPTLWTQGAVSRGDLPLEQRWFMGAHANVGGGYASPPRTPLDLLPRIPAAWLLEMSVKHGLETDGPLDVPAEAYDAEPIDSYDEFVGQHLFLRQVCQRHARVAGRTLNETIDQSLTRRLQDPAFLAEFPGFRDELHVLRIGK